MAYQPRTNNIGWPQYVGESVASHGALATLPQNYADLIASSGNLRNAYGRTVNPDFSQTIRNMLTARDAGSGYVPFGGNGPAPGGTTGGSDGFGLVKVSKDPTGRFDNIGQGALDTIQRFKPDYSAANSTASGAVNLLNSGGADLGANRGDAESLIDKWRRLSPELDKQVADQTTALNRVYDPNGLKRELAGNTQAAADAERVASTRAINSALFQARLHGAGGAGSSYSNLQAADATGRIAEETAARTADRRRQDTAALLSAQERNLGRTQDLATQQVLRGRIPIDTRNNILDQEARAAAQRLSAAGQQVNIQQLTDQLSTVARQLGLSGQALNQYLAANFTGVKKEGENYPLFVDGLPGRRNQPQSYFPDYSPSHDYLNNLRGGGNPTTSPRTRSQMEEIYRANAGVYPDQDPLFSQNLMDYANRMAERGNQAGQPQLIRHPQIIGDEPPAGPMVDQSALGNYYYPDENGQYLY